MAEARKPHFYKLSRGERESTTPSFVSVHGSDNGGRFGSRIEHWDVNRVLYDVYAGRMPSEDATARRAGIISYFRDLTPAAAQAIFRNAQRSGRFSLLSAVHSNAAMAYVQPVGAGGEQSDGVPIGTRKGASRRIREAQVAHVVDFAVRPDIAGWGIGTTLLHAALDEYSPEAAVQFDVLDVADSSLEAWLARLAFEPSDQAGTRRFGELEVGQRTFVGPSVGVLRAQLEATEKFKPVPGRVAA